MIQPPTPKLTPAGRFLIYALAGFTAAMILSVMVISCSRASSRQRAQAERPWGQGYEDSGRYMQPDHGYMYYWWLSSLGRSTQPTYHVYVPPPNYPPQYRPWLHYDQTTRTVYTPDQWRSRQPVSTPPTRTNGGFSSTPSTPPSPAPNHIRERERPTRTSGGFSKPAEKSTPPSRTNGGFSKPSGSSKSSSPSRSSGGFSRRKK